MRMKLDEAKVAQLIAEELSKKDVVDMAKKDKDFEKAIKKIVADVLCDMYRVLWQHNTIFKTLGN